MGLEKEEKIQREREMKEGERGDKQTSEKINRDRKGRADR